MNQIKKENTIILKSEAQEKIITLANNSGISTDALLNMLIDDEIERQRLLKISDDTQKEDSKLAVPSQQITKICKKHLSALDCDSENIDIRQAIENLYIDLLQQKLLFVNSREGCIAESKVLKTSRVAYYWFAGILAKNTGLCFGTLEVYLWHNLLHPFSEIVFIGMPTNVEVSYQVFLHLYQLFLKIQITYKKNNRGYGSKSQQEEQVNRYMCDFAQELDHINAYIENDNCNHLLYNYADKKYAYTMCD
jgi:hypothetical protein